MLRLTNYWKRLFKYPLIPNYLGKAFERGKLESEILDAIAGEFDRLMAPILLDDKIWSPQATADAKSSFVNSQREFALELSRQDIRGYLPILRNQALVLTCTVFDDCLYEVLKIVTDLRPEVLRGLVKKDDITAFDVIELKDYPKVFGLIQTKVLERFSFDKPVSRRIKAFERIGIDLNSLFKLTAHSPEVQAEYPDGAKLLDEIYETRNDIVHRDIMAIKTQDELALQTMFLKYLLTELCYRINQKFGIPIDFIETAKAALKQV